MDFYSQTMRSRLLEKFLLPMVALLTTALSLTAQDLDPRRWSHLPINTSFAGAGYAVTLGDIYFDPVLELEDVEMDLQTIAAKYVHTFAALGRSARVEMAVPWQTAEWTGLLQGEPASTSRSGFADPQARVSINLVGGPPLAAADFAAYRAAHPVETIIGAGLTTQLPLGEYIDEKLLNLGENRYVFRPELGVEHRHGRWIAEINGYVAFYTDNEDFWKDTEREQDPLYISQAFLSYTFRPGLWVGTGLGYASGGKTTINQTPKDDAREIVAMGAVLGVPINKSLGLKFAYLNHQTRTDTGMDADTLAAALSVLW